MPRSHGTHRRSGRRWACVRFFFFSSVPVGWRWPGSRWLAPGFTLLLCTLLDAAADSAICLRMNLRFSVSLENCPGALITLFSVEGGLNGYLTRVRGGYALSAAELVLSRCVWPVVAGSVSPLSPHAHPLLLGILAHVESFVIDAHALNCSGFLGGFLEPGLLVFNRRNRGLCRPRSMPPGRMFSSLKLRTKAALQISAGRHRFTSLDHLFNLKILQGISTPNVVGRTFFNYLCRW